MAYFAQASIDERGKISGGEAGNQSGKELNTCAVYSSSSKPWWAIIALSALVLAEINRQMKAAVANPYIGYDQYQRNTIIIQAKKVGWDLGAIKVACECDCAALDAAAMICAVYRVLGTEAGDAVYSALYGDGNLPATSTFRAKVSKLSAYFRVSESADYTVGALDVRDGHAVGVVDSLVTAGRLSSGATGSAASSLASSKYPCKGWSGDEVKRLQKALIEKGYSCGTAGADGDFGPDTDEAVRKFQADRGMEDDGIVGPMTQTALYGGSAPAASSTSYSPGEYITTVGSLRVRTGAGIGYSQKAKGELTADGQRHSDSLGQLNSGTSVTVSKVLKDSGGNTWGQIPSGWICLEWNGNPYVKRK